MKNFKPTGYTSISPYFVVAGAANFIDFATKLFGAKPLRRYEMPDKTVLHAELQIDDSVIMLGDASEQYPPRPQLVHLYVEDVDALFEKAKNLDCEIIDPPRTRPNDPDKRGTFKDPFGNFWSVASQLEIDE